MSDDGPGAREVAHRVFAAEFDDASLSYSESDEERAPNYVVTPTGARVNRLFTAGVLTEVERVNDETRRGRVVDPSGAFVTYAGQYQPEAQTFLERAEPPAFVALTGKARTFEPEDSDRVFTSVRPESLNAVDADTRDRWVVSAAEATLDRLAVFAKALDSDLRGEELRIALESGGAPASLAAGVPKAIAHYDTSTAYVEALRRLAVDALKLIAGDRDEVRAPEIAPDVGGEAAIGALPETDVTIEAPPESTGDEGVADSGAEPVASEPDEPASEPDEPASEPDEPASEPESAVTGDEEPAGAEPDDGLTDEPADQEPDDESDGLGDFDAGTDDTETVESGGDDAEVDLDEPSTEPASDEMYELDDEEREEIESEFGTDFSTGSEVDEPGEADIDVPDPEGMEESPTEEAAAESAPDSESESEESADDVDLEAAAIEAMDALDDGDGADREAVVEAVVDDHGAAADAVEDAIQDALMSGKCYEPGDGVLKPI
ncbi:hypothetical protein [Halorubrum sp. N11]|uniref:RPA family protein n=1 Tax=Halorubrum sp. N11 TaxID=3402276 RepID=UPI003EB9C966